jgi:hypothetical protein
MFPFFNHHLVDILLFFHFSLYRTTPQHREERAAMRAANEMKNTVMQTITKTHKLKSLNKKQLRQIKKTAINAKTGQLELVSPWKK